MISLLIGNGADSALAVPSNSAPANLPVSVISVNSTQQQVEMNVTLPSTATFVTLMHQAIGQTATLVPQLLAQNPLATQVTVRIMGERQGLEAPLLFLTVSRMDWQKNPQVQPWAKLFSYSEILLGFVKPAVPAVGVVATTSQPVSIAALPNARAMRENDPAYRDD